MQSTEAALTGKIPAQILRNALPGVIAEQSARNGGIPLEIPEI